MLRSSLSSLSPADREAWLAKLSETDAAIIQYAWAELNARPEQIAPVGDWRTWLILAGRGWGKTRTGAETCRAFAEQGIGPGALVGRTAADVRDVMVEGPAGLLAISPPWFKPNYEPSKRRITWPNGVTATTFSADEPDLLRGPQHAWAWADEIAAWRYLDDTWSNLQFGLRLGVHPRQWLTTTPRPLKLLRQLMKDDRTRVTRGGTRENAINLAADFLREMEDRYAGTRLGRQELDGEILDDVPGALWLRDDIDRARVKAAPDDLDRIAVAIDPPVTSGEEADECGMIVAGAKGRGTGAQGYVLADLSRRGESPQQWATRAVRAYHEFNADRIVVEINNGGEMIEATIRQVDPNISIRTVHATRGKVLRAEPVAALYEQGRVHHVGSMPDLEDQMCSFTTDYDRKANGSPDRLDALVWSMTDLMLAPRGELWVI